MGPGRVTTTGEGSMYTVESAQRARQGSLQLLARGVGPQGPQGRGGQGLQQDISRGRRQSCNTEHGAPTGLSITLPGSLALSSRQGHLCSSTHPLCPQLPPPSCCPASGTAREGRPPSAIAPSTVALRPLCKDCSQPISTTDTALLEMSAHALAHFGTPRRVQTLLGTHPPEAEPHASPSAGTKAPLPSCPQPAARKG